MKNRLVLAVMALFTIVVISACDPVTYDTFGNISGTVIDKDTGEPLDDAYISLTPKSKPNIYSGSDGQFEFRDLEVGQYTVAATKTGYEADRTIVNVIAGETVSASLVMEKR